MATTLSGWSDRSKLQLPVANMPVPLGSSPKRVNSYPGHYFGITRFLVLSAWLACAFLFTRPNDVHAGPKAGADVPGEEPVDLAERPTPYGEQLRKERRRGPVFLAIPLAYRYGIAGQDGAYCSPSIRATNSSNETIEELIVGIDFLTAAGKPAGATITRYADIKIRRQDTHFFYQLDVPECKGLEGRVSIVRCVYSTGEDCSSEIQPLGFGAIPLRLKSR